MKNCPICNKVLSNGVCLHNNDGHEYCYNDDTGEQLLEMRGYRYHNQEVDRLIKMKGFI